MKTRRGCGVLVGAGSWWRWTDRAEVSKTPSGTTVGSYIIMSGSSWVYSGRDGNFIAIEVDTAKARSGKAVHGSTNSGPG